MCDGSHGIQHEVGTCISGQRWRGKYLARRLGVAIRLVSLEFAVRLVLRCQEEINQEL